MRTLVDLVLEAAALFAPRPALAIRRELRTASWRYDELPGAIACAAARLEAAGLQPGDRVAFLAPNSPELVISMLGAWQLGCVLVPLDLGSTADVLARICQQSEPRLVIAAFPAAGLDGLKTLSPLEIGGRAAGAAAPSSPATRASGQTELAEIVYTSGTTGAPKGVMLTHANILANVASSLAVMPIPPGTRLLSLLPLSHMLEQTVGLLAALAAGTTIYYATSRRSTALLSALQRYRIQLIIGVPELLRLLLAGIEREAERTGQRQRLQALLALADRLPIGLRPLLFRPIHRRLGGHLRLVQCGGAPLDPALWRTWERLGVRVVQGYGATECAPVISSNRLKRRLPGSVGWPLPSVEVRRAADGELLVRGPNVMSGYWRDQAATAEVFDGDWYRTGDVVDLGSAGELYIRGRKKEMLVLASGRNVFPQDVEDEVKRDPAVKDCTIVGKHRPDGGVEVHAVLIPSADPATAIAAARAANARLGPHQQIGGISIWPADDFPRTSSLKVKRLAVLAALEQAESGDQLTIVPDAGPATDQPTGRVRDLVARASGRRPELVQPCDELGIDLGLDSLARVELAVLIEEELGRVLADDELAGLRTVADLQALLEQAPRTIATDPLPAWPRHPVGRLARSLLQDLVLFPLLRRFFDVGSPGTELEFAL